MSAPFLRLQIRIHVVCEEHPLNELIRRYWPLGWYKLINVQPLAVLYAAAKAPLDAHYMHELIVSIRRHALFMARASNVRNWASAACRHNRWRTNKLGAAACRVRRQQPEGLRVSLLANLDDVLALLTRARGDVDAYAIALNEVQIS